MHERVARGGGRLPAALARFLIGGVLVLGAGCREAPPVLEGGLPSKEALAQAVVDAMATPDRDTLAALAISEGEFRTHIWPRLPASRPGVGMPADYVWADTSIKSRGHLARAIEARAGRRATVEQVTFRGPATDYGGIRIHPETELTLREEGRETTRARLFGSMVEAGGRWKVYSYIVD